MLGQLPTAHVSPDLMFNKVGIDYAGPGVHDGNKGVGVCNAHALISFSVS